MEREKYYQIIREKLAYMATEVELDAKVHLYNIHSHAENFFCQLLNKICGLNLVNINSVQMNAKAIDLVDKQNKIIVQVTSRNDKEKVQSSLDGLDVSKYDGFNYRFISISRDCSELRKKEYSIPSQIVFNPLTDILDISSLLKKIQPESIELLENVSSFLEKEINPVNKGMVRPQTITFVINQIAETDLQNIPLNVALPFEIGEKITFNNLNIWKNRIADYAIYSTIVDGIYDTFNKQGKNKSLAVLNHLNRIYLEMEKSFSGDELFDKILDRVSQDVCRDSACDEGLSPEDIEMNVSIILVDAFMKCKILKRPV